MVKTVRTGDTLPWVGKLTTNKKPADLRGVLTVTFDMRPLGNNLAPHVEAVAEILQYTHPVTGKIMDRGKVLWRPGPTDLAIAGARKATWRVVWADGSAEVFPTEDDLHVRIIQS